MNEVADVLTNTCIFAPACLRPFILRLIPNKCLLIAYTISLETKSEKSPYLSESYSLEY